MGQGLGKGLRGGVCLLGKWLPFNSGHFFRQGAVVSRLTHSTREMDAHAKRDLGRAPAPPTAAEDSLALLASLTPKLLWSGQAGPKQSLFPTGTLSQGNPREDAGLVYSLVPMRIFMGSGGTEEV